MIIGQIAYAASPSAEDFRIFNSESALTTYLGTPAAKAGQGVKVLDSTSGKYKAYIIQGTAGHFTTSPMGAGDFIGSQLPSVAEGDEDLIYYIYNSEDDIYQQYRFNGTRYILVGSNNKKAYVGSSLPGVGDTDIDYYIGTAQDGFIHYRYFADEINDYIAVGGDSYTKAEVDALLNAQVIYYYYLSYGTAIVEENGEQIEKNNVVRLWRYTNPDDVGDTSGELGTVVTWFELQGGGSGSSQATNMTFNRVTSENIAMSAGDVETNGIVILASFADYETGGEPVAATYSIKVGNTVVETGTAIQCKDASGNQLYDEDENPIYNVFDVTDYCPIGKESTVAISITDEYGNMIIRRWYVKIVDISISSKFDDSYSRPVGSAINFPYKPEGLGTKTIHFVLDGVEIGTASTNNTAETTYSIPSTYATYGSHFFDCYVTTVVGGSTITSNHIYKDIVCYSQDGSLPVIGCIYRNDMYGTVQLNEYDTLNIPYTVYDPSTNNPTVTLSVDGTTVDTSSLTSHSNIWAFKGSEVGSHTLTIACGSTSVTIVVNVIDLGYDISPVTTGLAFDFDPTGITNSSTNRLWHDTNDNTVALSVSANFDWDNGGYQIDSETGESYFLVKAGTRATISYNLFGTNPKYDGAEFKLVFKTGNVRDAEATFLSCVSDNIGLKMDVHSATIANSVNIADPLWIPYSEEDIIEFEYNISPSINGLSYNPLIMTYEDGVPFKPLEYTSGTFNTLTGEWNGGAQLHQDTPVPITIGSDDCDVYIYRMKAYTVSLSDSQILDNFIADARNSETMVNRYVRNQVYDRNSELTPESVAEACPNLRVITISAPYFTNDKDEKVPDTIIEYIYKNGDPVLENWKAINCKHSGQGTTSNDYGFAGRNMLLYLNDDNTVITLGDDTTTVSKVALTFGNHINIDPSSYPTTADYTEAVQQALNTNATSIPNNVFNIKVNIASSENANNALLAKRYNDYLPYKMPAQKRDSRVKNTMEFVNCVVFIKETDNDLTRHREFQDKEWHFYALGNIGDAKKTDKTRVNDKNDPKEFVIEIKDNGKPNSGFNTGTGTYPISASQWVAGNSAYDSLYNNWDSSFEFRYTKADYDPKNNITSPQAELNKQKWRDFYEWVITVSDADFPTELGDWFIVDSALYYYVFTHRYTMIDNRAKNSFWHWSKVYITEAEAAEMGETEASYYTIDNAKAAINEGYRFEMWGYDFDTALGINNSGVMSEQYRYGKEDSDYRSDGDSTSGYLFNEATSVFWCRLRDLMPTEIANMYQTVATNKSSAWDAEHLINEFDNWQAQFPEEIWRLNYEREYTRTYQSGVDRFMTQMMQGRKKYHRRQWERDQAPYFGTKYGLIYYKNTDRISFRCNQPIFEVDSSRIFGNQSTANTYLASASAAVDQNVKIKQQDNTYKLYVIKSVNGSLTYIPIVEPNYDLTIKPYSDLYLSAEFGNDGETTEVVAIRAKAGQSYTIECPAGRNMTNTMVKIYCGSHIQELSDLSPCYIEDNDVSMARKLRKLIIGNSTLGYRSYITTLKLGNNPILEELNIENCNTFTNPSIDLTNCGNLVKFYANGSNITQVSFANYGKVADVEMPANINTISMRNLNYLEDANFDMPSYSSMRSATIVNGILDTKTFMGNISPYLTYLYLTGFDWTFLNVDFTNPQDFLIEKLYAINSVTLIGTIRIDRIPYRYVQKYHEKWGDDFVIDATLVVPEYSITFLNDDKTPISSIDNNTPYVEWVDGESAAYNPITEGYVNTPTKASSAKYDYTFSHWAIFVNNTAGAEYTFGRVLSSNITLIAVYTSSLRTFTVNWYTSPVNTNITSGKWNSKNNSANKTLLHTETNVQYGAEVSFDITQKVNCKNVTSGNVTYLESYVFSSWSDSTGGITGDTDVYAVWDYAKIFKNNGELILEDTLGNRKALNNMTSAEIAAVCANGEATTFFHDKDYFDYIMGHDYSFANVDEEVLVPLGEELHLDGVTPIIPTDSQGNQIKLFSADAPSFTMAIDYQFTNDANDYAPSNNKTLISCFENPDNGNDGFALRYYSNKANVLWGDKNQNVTTEQNRDMLVLRHVQGSDELYIYAFNGGDISSGYYSNTKLATSKTRTAYNSTNAPLVFGGIAEYDSENQVYIASDSSTYIGAGIIYWCKIWYADLGDTVAKELASWTRDDDRQEYYQAQLDSAGTLFGSPYLLSGTSTRASASFISNNLMRYLHQMNVDNVNAGGWGGNTSTEAKYQASMHYFMQYKFYPAIPNEIRNLIVQVKVPSTTGSQSSNIGNYDSYVYIPCYREMADNNDTKNAPYSNEGSFISWNTTNQRRLGFRDIITLDTSLLANGNAKFTGSSEPIFAQNKGFYDADSNPNGVREYDIWHIDNNNVARIYLSAQTLRKKNITPTVAITQGTELLGGWCGAYTYFLRSPNTGNANNFWYVNLIGATNNYSNANYWIGVRPCFSIFAQISQNEN